MRPAEPEARLPSISMSTHDRTQGRSTTRPSARRGRGRWAWAHSAALLAIGAVSLYLLLPSLLAVFGSWRSLEGVDWPFVALALAAELASYLCLWELDRIALHTGAWRLVAAAQLTGNAAGRVFPGAGVTATAVSSSMLEDAGIERGDAAAALGASSLLQVGTALALPIVALPAAIGSASTSHDLRVGAYLALVVLVVLAALVVATFASDTPLRVTGRALERVLNATVDRRSPVTGLDRELLGDRDFVRRTIGARWRAALAAAVGNAAFDYLALLCALHAVGAHADPALVLLAYAGAEVLALIPVTPGGLGFVEAGLAGMLAVAGVRAPMALAATLLYRLIAFWLPLPAGGVAFLMYRRGRAGERTG
jgi:uncharacterized protein (TIRG00374 family)